ncbi:ATP-binding protein [Cellulomonas shaoxiangyii]|uniref:ATPase n=1 Tax=Cellulomonas shaoxiangyii TaxID=2566013 RepID=A0A4P7SFV6_9CELL|nr:AAA family ATPase [Cellulomonas shaoxiangyii]QCB93059.1 ATPase [Cellulomonas shaoxiangyii]TGY82990.1 ATPase [Cellulomonas shaoxiangyii]
MTSQHPEPGSTGTHTAGTGPAGTGAAGAGAAPDGPVLRPHAEDAYAGELAALAAADDRPRPPGWRLSPWAVTTYLVGGTLADGTEVSVKYLGSRRLMEIAVASLATDRALLLLGVPGTAKTWVGEHLAAAVSGDSTLVVQGTAGTPEEQLRYGWNYARLLADGPTAEAVVPSPVMRAMRDGTLVRIEELTRIPADVQDALISILSEKTLPVPELRTEVQARPGFNVIATANDRDKGVNDLSSALRRRFNTVVLPLPDTLEQEVEIVRTRVAAVGRSLELPPELAGLAQIERVVTVFRELRGGVTLDRRTTVKSPSATLSTAEAISVVTNGTALAAHFGDGVLRAEDVAASLTGAVVQDPVQDRLVWQEYLETVLRDRAGWEDLYRACRELV